MDGGEGDRKCALSVESALSSSASSSSMNWWHARGAQVVRPSAVVAVWSQQLRVWSQQDARTGLPLGDISMTCCMVDHFRRHRSSSYTNILR
jgi:hypothetical protein